MSEKPVKTEAISRNSAEKTRLDSYKVSDRGYREYLALFHLPESFLKGKHIIDVGAGLSDFAETVNRKLADTGARAIAVDINYDIIGDPDFMTKVGARGGTPMHYGYLDDPNQIAMYQEDRRKAVAEAVKKGTAVAGDWRHLPLPDKSADLVLFNNSFYPYLSPAARNQEAYDVLKESRRVMTPDGQIRICSVPMVSPDMATDSHGLAQAKIKPESVEKGGNVGMLVLFQRLQTEGANFYLVESKVPQGRQPSSFIITNGDHAFSASEISSESGEETTIRKLSFGTPEHPIVSAEIVFKSEAKL